MIVRMPDEPVHAFFEAFCDAFATFDGEAVARLYHVPHWQVLTSTEHLSR